MRKAEGEKLKEDVLSRLVTIENILGEIEIEAPLRVRAYREKLYSKLLVILEDRQIDEGRILTEAAVFCRQGGNRRRNHKIAQPHCTVQKYFEFR